MTQLTPEMVAAFVEYLKANGKGDMAPKAYFRMFKRMVTAAVDKDLIKKNPCRGFVIQERQHDAAKRNPPARRADFVTQKITKI